MDPADVTPADVTWRDAGPGATPGGRVTPRRSFDSPLAHPLQ